MCFKKPFDPNDNVIILKHNEQTPNDQVYFNSDNEYLNYIVEQSFLIIDDLVKMLSLRNLDYYYDLFKHHRFGYDLGPERSFPNSETFIEYYLVDENGYYDDNLENHNRDDKEWIAQILLEAELEDE